VYDRELGERTLTLRPSGWTYKNTFVLMDEETGSLWYPDSKGLLSIQGELLGQLLPKIDSDDTDWKTWNKKHPGSLILY